MTELIQLETSIKIAVNAHYGQKDKAGSPYIFHPMRVMNSVSSIDEKIVAILHDVIEDTDVTFNDLLKEGIPPHLIDILKLLTHSEEVSYDNYIKNLSNNSIASNVKLADLKDNSDISRLKVITQKDLVRLEKYKRAIAFLQSY